MTGIDSVALVLHNAGRTVDLLGASDPFAAQVEDAQLVVGQGPGFAAFETGIATLVGDTSAVPARWPMFLREAARLGVGAMFAFPLRVGGIRIGAFDLCRREPGPLPAAVATDATLLADLISRVLVEDVPSLEPGTAPPATTLRDVNVATGMIAAQLGITLDEALLRLRAWAFATERPLLELARDVLERRVDLDGDLR